MGAQAWAFESYGSWPRVKNCTVLLRARYQTELSVRVAPGQGAGLVQAKSGRENGRKYKEFLSQTFKEKAEKRAKRKRQVIKWAGK